MDIKWAITCCAFLLAGCAATEEQQLFEKKQGDIEVISQLSDQVRETSGLAYYEGLMWTINDGGDEPAIYAINDGYEIEKRILLEGAKNIDWESLAQDHEYLYIADCGNNRATRSTITIYKVSWLSLYNQSSVVVPEVLTVTYSDFADTKVGKNHNFDCEAVTIVDGELWLFTKNRADLKTKLYRLNASEPRQMIKPSAQYDVDGLITAADYDPKTKQLALLGYGKNVIFGQSFVWIIPVNGTPDWERSKRLKLNPYAQWEAIMWDPLSGGSELILTSEKSPLLDVSVGRLRISE
ncbi:MULTISPECIES: hypothetical protein [unclassified Neptuniibacter]|uniref:hypothetical protein n=1 Tax=unclassified Neptuniibacter TaxID=2630693 RepID=UPI000C5DD0B2|nr:MULTISPECIES: hypothetical protein [unclassified Neptuniibacter]MAY41348.1 hypothetical protein [Oceanospirillaceae bacterium]|tara:strand:+ start:26714 stop:27598 length:885 start_codon:yes stop_codon:yes gene_type:complete